MRLPRRIAHTVIGHPLDDVDLVRSLEPEEDRVTPPLFYVCRCGATGKGVSFSGSSSRGRLGGW